MTSGVAPPPDLSYRFPRRETGERGGHPITHHPNILIDVTVCLTLVGPYFADRIRVLSQQLVLTHSLGVIDTWKKHNREFIRVTYAVDVRNMFEAMATLGDASKDWLDCPPGVVQIALRDVAWRANEGLPPARV